MKPPDILIELNNKNLFVGGFCTYRRQYSNKSGYFIGKIKQIKKGIFITEIIDIYAYCDKMTIIKINYDNIVYTSYTTHTEKTLWKLWKLV